MTKRGIGYEVGDVLALNQLEYNAGVSTSPFTVTIKSKFQDKFSGCLLYTSPSPRDLSTSRMPSSA